MEFDFGKFVGTLHGAFSWSNIYIYIYIYVRPENINDALKWQIQGVSDKIFLIR